MNFIIKTRYNHYNEKSFIDTFQSQIDNKNKPNQNEVDAEIIRIMSGSNENSKILLIPIKSYEIGDSNQSIFDFAKNGSKELLNILHRIEVRSIALNRLWADNKVMPVANSPRNKTIEISINHSNGNFIYNVEFDSLPFSSFQLTI